LIFVEVYGGKPAKTSYTGPSGKRVLL